MERGKTCRQPDARHSHHHPGEVKHWHGAKKDSWFSHIAVEVPGEETGNEWCEPVDDEAYNGLE